MLEFLVSMSRGKRAICGVMEVGTTIVYTPSRRSLLTGALTPSFTGSVGGEMSGVLRRGEGRRRVVEPAANLLEGLGGAALIRPAWPSQFPFRSPLFGSGW